MFSYHQINWVKKYLSAYLKWFPEAFSLTNYFCNNWTWRPLRSYISEMTLSLFVQSQGCDHNLRFVPLVNKCYVTWLHFFAFGLLWNYLDCLLFIVVVVIVVASVSAVFIVSDLFATFWKTRWSYFWPSSFDCERLNNIYLWMFKKIFMFS